MNMVMFIDNIHTFSGQQKALNNSIVWIDLHLKPTQTNWVVSAVVGSFSSLVRHHV